jgi:hypothetical protein
MNNEDIILAAIEELANEVKGLKNNSKTIEPEIFSLALMKIEAIEEVITQPKPKATPSPTVGLVKETHRIVNDLQETILKKRPEITHKYIEIRNSKRWLIGVGAYVLITLIACIALVTNNISLKQNVKSIEPYSYKYRYLKLSGLELSRFIKSNISNTTDIVYLVDDHYQKNETEVKEYVIKTEEAIRKAFEAAEIAKQKEAEAKAARAEAERLEREKKQ